MILGKFINHIIMAKSEQKSALWDREKKSN